MACPRVFKQVVELDYCGECRSLNLQGKIEGSIWEHTHTSGTPSDRCSKVGVVHEWNRIET